MAQPSVTVVIPVWNQWEMTKACLETLRPTLGVHDKVVVVDNGSEDETAKGLRRFPWVTVITNNENRGFATACNQGAAVAAGEVIVFLNNDTLLPGRWLDGLLEPFADATVSATGPRSNFVSGLQLVEEPEYQVGSMSSLRRFARQWRDDHRGQTEETTRLVGFCIAVRRSSFEAIGGWDEDFGIGGVEDDDLCLRLVQAGGRLLVTHESFVHHHGHATFDANGIDWFALQQDNLDRLRTKFAGGNAVRFTPRPTNDTLLSACLIVKDEAELLSACLSSLNGLVDEVIVYDTGSTDGTQKLARDAGATVIEGYWDDDFGRARNAALEHCTGTWVLHIDADETFDGNAQTVRDFLVGNRAGTVDVNIKNLSGGGRNDVTHRPCRMFKRALHNWQGRLHEQVCRRDGGAPTQPELMPGGHLIHSGYLPDVMVKKGKADRNIRIAAIDAEVEDGRDQVDKLANLARSYVLGGRHQEALTLFTQARALPTSIASVRRTVLRGGAQASLTLGQFESVLRWADELEAESKSDHSARFFRGMAYAQLGQWVEVLDELRGLDVMIDDDGILLPILQIRSRRAAANAAVGNWAAAADDLAFVATANAHEEHIWALVADAYWHTDRDVAALFAEVPAVHLPAVFAQLTAAVPAAADRVLEALAAIPERQGSVLALAVRLAPELSTERALEWSARLRKVGMEEHCPLIARAFDTRLPALDRLHSAAVASGAFEERRAVAALKLVAGTCPVEQLNDALLSLNELAPYLLEPFITAVATDGTRAFAIARLLYGFGAADEAVAVLTHGLGRNTDPSLADQAAAWLHEIGRDAEAESVRETRT